MHRCPHPNFKNYFCTSFLATLTSLYSNQNSLQFFKFVWMHSVENPADDDDAIPLPWYLGRIRYSITNHYLLAYYF